mgnify:CR=1 FL=1
MVPTGPTLTPTALHREQPQQIWADPFRISVKSASARDTKTRTDLKVGFQNFEIKHLLLQATAACTSREGTLPRTGGDPNIDSLRTSIFGSPLDLQLFVVVTDDGGSGLKLGCTWKSTP